MDESIDAQPLVLDSAASNSKELLNAYIYDFLLKSGFKSTATEFYREAQVPLMKDGDKILSRNLDLADEPLPKCKMAMDAPHGFIYEWWQIFWDVFNARTQRGGTTGASQYYQYINLKQRQDQAMVQQMQISSTHQQQQQPQSHAPTPQYVQVPQHMVIQGSPNHVSSATDPTGGPWRVQNPQMAVIQPNRNGLTQQQQVQQQQQLTQQQLQAQQLQVQQQQQQRMRQQQQAQVQQQQAQQAQQQSGIVMGMNMNQQSLKNVPRRQQQQQGQMRQPQTQQPILQQQQQQQQQQQIQPQIIGNNMIPTQIVNGQGIKRQRMSISGGSANGLDPITTSPHALSVPATANNGITPNSVNGLKEFDDNSVRNTNGSHFAEFSSMLGQLRQSPSTAATTDSPILPNGVVIKKKQPNRRIRKNSSSIPVTPNTPGTPGINIQGTPAQNNNKRSRRRGNGASSITTPATVKEEEHFNLQDTGTNVVDQKNSQNKKISNKINKNVKEEKGDIKPESLLTTSQSQMNFIDGVDDPENDLLAVDPGMGDFNTGDNFFDFGLYNGNDGGLGEFSWNDSVEGTNLN